MQVKELKKLDEMAVTPANQRNAEDIKLINQLLMQSANLFYQNNALAGKDYIKRAAGKLEELQMRIRNS